MVLSLDKLEIAGGFDASNPSEGVSLSSWIIEDNNGSPTVH